LRELSEIILGLEIWSVFVRDCFSASCPYPYLPKYLSKDVKEPIGIDFFAISCILQ